MRTNMARDIVKKLLSTHGIGKAVGQYIDIVQTVEFDRDSDDMFTAVLKFYGPDKLRVMERMFDFIDKMSEESGDSVTLRGNGGDDILSADRYRLALQFVKYITPRVSLPLTATE